MILEDGMKFIIKNSEFRFSSHYNFFSCYWWENNMGEGNLHSYCRISVT